MATSSDLERSLAHQYAQAMLQLAEEGGQAEQLLGELDQLVALLASHERDFEGFRSPLTSPDRRRESIEKILRGKVSDLLTDSMQVANSKRRVGLVPAIAQSYREQLNELRQRVIVEVETAVPLSDELRQRMIGRAQRYTNKEVTLEERVDPDLIAGLVVRIGDERVDRSAARELRILKRRLMDRSRQRREGGEVTEAADSE